MRTILGMLIFLMAATSQATDAPVKVSLNFVNESGVVGPAGEVLVTASPYGLVFTPSLSGLPAGIHGFHIHEKASCDAQVKDGKPVAALGAGGHWDPDHTGRHAGPFGDGHKGDLPALYVGADGNASYPVLAPRLKTLDELRGHALMVHVGGDNHDDHPAALGGGGVRLACGVIQ